MLDLGDPLPASLATIQVTDSDGALVDAPALPVLTVTLLATGTTQVSPTNFTVTHPATGFYTVVYTPPAAGQFELSWAVAGPNGGVYKSTITVASQPAPFISTDDAIRHMRATGIIVQAADMEQLRWLCLVACRAVERDLGRAIARRAVVEEHEPTGTALILRQTPVLSVTSVSIDGTVQDPAGYRLGLAGILRSRSGWPTGGWSTVQVDYVAGMDPVPEVLQKVALNAVQRMWQTSQNSPHPAFDNSGGGEFSAADLAGQMGRLTPVEMGAYRSYQSSGIA